MTTVHLRFTRPWSGWPAGATVDVGPAVAKRLAAYTEPAWTEEDLEVVDYIGPIRERALVQAGIVSLAQLADLTPEMREKAEAAGAGIGKAWLKKWAKEAKKTLAERRKRADDAQQLHSED